MPFQTTKDYLPENYEDLTDTQKDTLQQWIANNLEPRNTLNRFLISSGLAHHFECDPTGFPVSAEAIKGALLASGYRVEHVKTVGWCFNIRQTSISRLLRRGKKYQRY